MTMTLECLPVDILQILKQGGAQNINACNRSVASSLRVRRIAESRIAVGDPGATLAALDGMQVHTVAIPDNYAVRSLRPLKEQPQLKHLNIRHIRCVRSLAPLAGLHALAYLDLSHTRVRSLGPLAALAALTYLDCSGTRVRNLGPLAALKALTYLDCSDNEVGDLGPLVALTALTYLDCSCTLVRDLAPLATLTALTFLHCCACGDARDLARDGRCVIACCIDCARDGYVC